MPNAQRLAEIMHALPLVIPRAAKNTLLPYYFKTFVKVGEIDQGKFISVLLFCTTDQQKSCSDFMEMEILAPPISNCIKCKSPLISQNKICTVTVVNKETFNDEFLKVQRRMTELINGPCSSLGYRSIWHILEMEGLWVPRVIVQDLFKEMDPEGTELHRKHCFKRRMYHNPGPNYA